MKRLLICGAFCLWGLSAQAQVIANKLPLEDVIDAVNPATVSVVTDMPDGSQALGSGIIISKDGYVVTNFHVTDGAETLHVILPDDTEYAAKLIGDDAKTDIALLRIAASQEFAVAEFADSEQVRVGNQVFAIGNPFGLGNSISFGIISAKERDIEKGPYDNFIQTDAAINQGNSGGPLFNMQGKIVGINTAIFSTDGKNMGIGFATPSNLVQWVVKQLQQKGKVVRGWLGIGVQKMRSTDSEQKNKLVIASMVEKSPAEQAGLKVGDVIESIGNLSLKNPRSFSLSVAQTAPETVLPVAVVRDGNTLLLQIKIEAMPEENIAINGNQYSDDSNNAETAAATEFSELGFSAYYNENSKEMVVTKVIGDSQAEIKGINSGDRFKIADNHKIYGMEDFKIKVKQARAKGEITLTFIGADTVDVITLKLRETDDTN